MDRIKVILFIPENSTVGQLLDILYWPKRYDLTEDELNGIRGARVEASVKPEYLDQLKEAVANTAGASLETVS